MSIAEKLTTVAQNVSRTHEVVDAYNANVSENVTKINRRLLGNSYPEGGETLYEKAVEEGKTAEWNRFWDAFQLNGTRTNYISAFYSAGVGSGGWNDEIFKPKYDIKLVGACDSIFFRTDVTDFTKSGCGVDIDFSQATNFNSVFYASGVVTIGVLDLRNVTAVLKAFQYCNFLKTIEKIILKDDGSQSIENSTFEWASELEEIRFEGAIGSNINFQWQSKLSGASITSIVNALSPTASGKTATFKQIAVMSNIGSPYEQEWLDLVATKPNWTISLV